MRLTYYSKVSGDINSDRPIYQKPQIQTSRQIVKQIEAIPNQLPLNKMSDKPNTNWHLGPLPLLLPMQKSNNDNDLTAETKDYARSEELL